MDIDALEREIKAMSGKRKKKKQKKTMNRMTEASPASEKVGEIWRGFYGIVAFFTYIVVEVIEIIPRCLEFGGFFDFLKQLNFNVIMQMFVQALMNFITAMVWPVTG